MLANEFLIKIKRINYKRAQRSKPPLVATGEQDHLDIISYSALEESPDYLCVDGQYIRTVFISGYPLIATSGWLDSLIQFNHSSDISFHINEVSAIYALPKLNRKITELESTKRRMLHEGKIIGPEISDPLESAIDLRNKIQRGQQKLFQISVYIVLRANSHTELDKLTQILDSTLSMQLFYTKIARYQQIEGLQSSLPRGEDILNQKRNLDSSSAALAFPFMSSELAQEGGILYGINKSNNSLVILNRYSLQNSNSILFAQTGSGKSYAAKVEILRQLMEGTKVIVIDPEREYKKLCKSVDGTYIKLSASSDEKINPFDLTTVYRSDEDLSEHVQDLTELISLMVDGLNNNEKAVVDKIIVKLYKRSKNVPPILRDLYGELKKFGEAELCNRLEKYVTGSLSHVFDQQTNIQLNNRLVVFDIKDLPESLRQIMMVIIAKFVSNQVRSHPEKRLLVIDEAWMLLEHEESARFVTNLVRRARKYYLGITIISQQVDDFLGNYYGRVIVSQSSLRILMRQDTTTIKKVASEFCLSEFESSFLLTCSRGEALIIADQNHVAVKIVASRKEHPLITTSPLES